MGSETYRGKPVQQPIAVVVSPEPTKERSLVERIFMPTGDPALSKKSWYEDLFTSPQKEVPLAENIPEKGQRALDQIFAKKQASLNASKPQETPAVTKPQRTTTRPSSVPAQIAPPSIAPPSIAPIAPPQEDKPWYSSLFSGGTPTKPGEYSGLREFGMGTAQFLGNLGNNLTKNYAGNKALNAGFAQKRLEYADRDPASNSSVLTRGMARELGMPIKGDESAFDLKQQMPYVRDMLAARAMQGRAGGGDVGQRMPKPPTEAQAKAKSFADRMAQAQSVLSDLESKAIANEEGGYHSGQFKIDSLPERAKSEARKKYEQAQRSFINATLRRESGAVISDAEAEEAARQYFPQPGDPVDVLKQKRIMRESITRNMSLEGAPASDYEAARQGGESVMQDKSGKRYRVKDGKVIGEL